MLGLLGSTTLFGSIRCDSRRQSMTLAARVAKNEMLQKSRSRPSRPMAALHRSALGVTFGRAGGGIISFFGVVAE